MRRLKGLDVIPILNTM